MQKDPNSPVVLIVEDDGSLRLLLREMLRQGGYAAVEAADGDAAVAAARERAPDLVLLDIGLPGVDGLTVLRRLRRDEALAGVPVLMVSAWSDAAYVEQALRAGAQDYIRKPFETAELLARVGVALRVKAAEDALRAAGGVLAREATRDALTRLPNRRALDAALSSALAGDGTAAVILLDVDRLKPVNDSHGHQAGDAVLREVALRLQDEAGPGQLAGRWGGDEFMVVAPGLGEAQAEALAGRLRHAVARTPVAIPGGSVEVGVGVGWAVGGDAPGELIGRADAMLYADKGARRAR